VYRLSANSQSLLTGRAQLTQFTSWVTHARESGLLRMSRGQYVKARIMIPLKFGARLALGVAGGLTGRTA
jgi:hypothetical protein